MFSFFTTPGLPLATQTLETPAQAPEVAEQKRERFGLLTLSVVWSLAAGVWTSAALILGHGQMELLSQISIGVAVFMIALLLSTSLRLSLQRPSRD